ncbi:MAG TPA: arylsulfatase [Bryobacteraceae bacterium]|nr:arylsulfatase [Bryobacteraceae bacterium]
MNRRRFLGTFAAAGTQAQAAPLARKRPNIILIMADDMGFSDIGCYGGEIATPNLDRLARRGVRFTQFYNTARCCPTRASLLTGLYPHQAGIGHMVDRVDGLPGYRGDLNRRCVTVAQVLRPAGYHTLMCGKWHVTPVTDSKHNWPLQRGFERYYGIIHGGGSYYDPVTLTRDNESVRPEGKDYYLTDALSNEAANFVREYARKPEPFFMYVAYTAPHWPLHALEADIAKYRGRYAKGWDALRAGRNRRMIEIGIVEKRWPLTPRDSRVPPWADAPEKEWQQRRMEVYAAQIDRMDQGIGRILQSLEQTGAAEDTLVMFLADNGGCAEEIRGWGPARHIPTATRDGRPVRVGNNPEIMPGPEDTYQSYGIPWANASNTPFRLYKHWVHEGGIATPFIASWPRAVQRQGTLTGQVGHIIDVMATCVDAAGARYPEISQGERIHALEGRSLLPVFEGRRRQGHPELYWEHEGNRAVRQGNWKLVSRHPDEWELYDLEADRAEMRNLAAAQPQKAAELAEKYGTWAQRVGVAPWQDILRRRKQK